MKTQKYLSVYRDYLPVFFLSGVMVLTCLSSRSVSQNIGIGVANPTEKLEVDGIVHSVDQGFMFPDGTIQSTASNAFEPQDAGDDRWIVILKCVSPLIQGSFTFDTLTNVIKVIDYGWGMNYIPPPPGGGSGELTIDSLRIIKNIDASTNILLHYALIGQVLGELRLYFLRPVDPGMQLYYRLIMNNVIITGFHQQMIYKGGQDFAHIEIIEFEFEGATWIYDDGILSNSTYWPWP